MAEAILAAPRFTNDDAAREYLESIRWPQGTICPHCGGTERNSAIASNEKKKIRAGLYFCGDCRAQFTVTVGTVFERSKIALHKWVLATHLMCASKKGMSSKQLERMLGVTYKTAWFMSHRIREAMKSEGGMLGGGGKTVEFDETFYGTKDMARGRKPRRSGIDKHAIFALVERNGAVRSFHVPRVNAKNLKPILHAQVAKDSHIRSDNAGAYRKMEVKAFLSHATVNHMAGEYVRGDVHSNTVEGFFSLLKRGLTGTFHHVSEQHLQRYCTEFDFRYTNRSKLGIEDTERTAIALKGISGKRLLYKNAN